MLLHGALVIQVVRARGLWDVSSRSAIEKLTKNLVSTAEIDPYAVVMIGSHKQAAKTHVVKDTDAPEWRLDVVCDCCDDVDDVAFAVKAFSWTKAKLDKSLGVARLPAERILREREFRGWFKLESKHAHAVHIPRKSEKRRGEIEIYLKYMPVEQIGARPETPWCYFPAREACVISMFADAHVDPGSIPPIQDGYGQPFTPRKCWEEIYTAIQGAQHFIYVTGWSVDTDTRLLRNGITDTAHQVCPTFGDLLKSKASQGVQVRVMVWDELLSLSSQRGAIISQGVMNTKDEETFAFFADVPNVRCVKTPRVDDGSSGAFGALKVSGFWTHHQKSVIVDAPFPPDPSRKRLKAYVGGLDITGGRWDTAEHELFSTLTTFHKDDFHQQCAAGVKPCTGPREPWHDIHSCVEGAIARDVVANFEERWKKQAAAHVYELYDMSIPVFVSLQEERDVMANLPETWTAQFFRSIDSRSCVFEREKNGVYRKKDHDVDASIQRAMVHQIRRAQRFIYIESQYFIGSSHSWQQQASSMAANLIPTELTQKILQKIERRESFAVYVLLPMHPEGVPESQAVQEILHWQFLTISTMYSKIAAALVASGNTEKAPTDYLSFYFLGARDGETPVYVNPSAPLAMNRSNSQSMTQPPASVSKRGMIYVHSKMMLVDDEYIMIGSNNINSRSLDGFKDTELAIGAWQPAHTISSRGGGLPRGAVHCFRLQLWGEHTRTVHPAYYEPHTEQCVRALQEIAFVNTHRFFSETNGALRSHLCSYPYVVDRQTGAMQVEYTTFPDTRASIRGKQTVLPNVITG